MAFDLYQEVTNRIIEKLEEGNIPWLKPWGGVAYGAYNIVSKRPYSLLNQLLLKNRGQYATYKQWKEKGGYCKKGCAEMVVFFKMLPVEKQNEDGETEKKIIPFLKYINVWHVSNVEFKDGKKPPKPLGAEEFSHTPIDEAEAVIAEYVSRDGLKFRVEVSNDAYYQPLTHTVVVPKIEQYKDRNEYYSTIFHELTHSTSKHLKREISGYAFGRESYSQEELVAEMGSCFIMSYLGIESATTFRNSAAYIQGWLKALKDDKRLIIKAAGRAEKATNYILNINQNVIDDDTE